MTTLATAVLLLAVAASDPDIAVGENVRVSAEETPYVEPYVARHPTLDGRLIAVATRFSDGSPNTPMVSVSGDGGGTWQESRLPIGTLQHAVDGWVTFSDTGTAYASFLVIEPGDAKTKIAVFKSGDAGQSWTRSATIAAARSFDRPTVIARGREVVIAAEHQGAVALLRSPDEGRSFLPVRSFRPTANLDHNAMNPVWRGSSIAIPYVDFGEALSSSRIAIVETGDFGRTWKTPSIVADVPRRLPGNAHAAASTASLHVAFASGTADARTVSVASSADGKTWRAPVRVSGVGSQAFRPAIAIATGGDVGATWIETEAGCTRLWFSVSRDGGRTFSKPVPVSEDLSCGDTPANRAAFERWEHGGDYYGLVADGDAFVAIWPDARGGTFQLYAARITVAPRP